MKKWTENDVRILKEMYEESYTPSEIAIALDRSKNSVKNKAYLLKITKPDNYTEEELKYIKDNYNTKNIREIAEDLGRGNSWQNICREARQLGLTKNKDRKPINHKDTPDNWQSEKAKKWYETHEHPKGMLGKKHSDEMREGMSERIKKEWSKPDSVFRAEETVQKRSDTQSRIMVEKIKNGTYNIYSRARSGKRTDLGIFVRSAWEANYARYLNFLIKQKKLHKWEYEPDTFWFEKIKRGTRSYTPDFKIWETKESEPYYVEVKGYMDQKSKTKLSRMAKYYPDVKIVLIQKPEYNEIKKWSGLIDNWE